MNFRRTALGIGLLGILAILGCGGDDTPTPDNPDAAISATTGAGGSGMGTDATTTGSGGSATDSAFTCKATNATSGNGMGVTGADIQACQKALGEAGVEDSGDEAGASCMACLCFKCPFEAKSCPGKPFCGTINGCCRSLCNCVLPPKEAGPEGSASDAPSSDSSSESSSMSSDADNGG